MILSLTQVSSLENYDLSLLTEVEVNYIQQAKAPILQSCRAHYCFEFRKLTGISSADAAILRTQEGQPYFANLNFNISISHKDQSCWLGMVKKPEIIGVDIETLVKPESVNMMFKHVANVNEKEHYQNISKEISKVEYLTVLWSLKESLYKCENSKHDNVSILIDPFQHSAQLNYGQNCPLESLWSQKQIQIKYSIQKPYVFSSIYVF